MRGSPHIHGLLWLDNPPNYLPGNEESMRACREFIDTYIACSRVVEEELSELIKLQVHKHSHSCYKYANRGGKCRFGFPRPPFPVTMILEPLEKNYDSKEKAKLRDTFKNIQGHLNEVGRYPVQDRTGLSSDERFHNFLGVFDLDFDRYILGKDFWICLS